MKMANFQKALNAKSVFISLKKTVLTNQNRPYRSAPEMALSDAHTTESILQISIIYHHITLEPNQFMEVQMQAKAKVFQCNQKNSHYYLNYTNLILM